MDTTVHVIPRMLASLLESHGVRDIVVSPGTRDVPLIVAMSRRPRLTLTTVVDERSAAFVALGIAVQTGHPVAMVCTSGTAMLNYAPAIAEAYYRGIPLIAVTADRPAAWIGQNDSQTLRQPGALANIVKGTVDIANDTTGKDMEWYANRRINDALLAATDIRNPGPVHINVQLDQPLGKTDTFDDSPVRVIRRILPDQRLSNARINDLARHIGSGRVAVVVGFHRPDNKLSQALARLASQPNVAVFHEAQSNLHGSAPTVFNPDTAVNSLSAEGKKELFPDYIITVGGSVVSANLKLWLRDTPTSVEHWAVGYGSDDTSIDVFGRLTQRIEAEPAAFISALAGAIRRNNPSSGYALRWRAISAKTAALTADAANEAPWCDLAAVRMLIDAVPAAWNLQVSNGMSVRYLQLADYRHIHSVECNRGVSGIDGSTSTAIGAAIHYPHPTLLLTGDMSAQYDIGALTAGCIPPTFRMAVLNNNGGDIFRFIATTRNVPERETHLAVGSRLDLEAIATAFGFEYVYADSRETMKKALKRLTGPSSRPILLDIRTYNADNADILRDIYKSLKNNDL